MYFFVCMAIIFALGVVNFTISSRLSTIDGLDLLDFDTSDGVESFEFEVISGKPQNEVPASSKEERRVVNAPHSTQNIDVSAVRPNVTGEMRGLWISFIEMGWGDLTPEQTRQRIREQYDVAAEMGFNAVIVHVRPFADAFYPSNYFPSSRFVAGRQGTDPGFDVLEYMVAAAHKRGLEFHAWINPYRISTSSSDPLELYTNHPARIWSTNQNPANADWVRPHGNGLFFNPAIPEVRQLIINGVREIVQNYDVDGIHFDDYFYPTTALTFDQSAYDRYIWNGGARNRSDWRREQVNILIRDTFSAINEIDPSVRFGISPIAMVERGRNELFGDAAYWMSRSGYVDYIAPQIYWGFEHPLQSARFDVSLDEWLNMPLDPSVSLYIGLANYKVGVVDAGSDEWVRNDDLISRQVELSRKQDNYAGFMMFSYRAVIGDSPHQIAERNNFLPLLQDDFVPMVRRR